jgi:peptidoglycan/xylan/chitin deacetylase (PgdA/CDA1 family)
METKTLIRRAAKAAVLPLGLKDRRGPGDVVILLYHRVGAGGREIDLPVSAFTSQLADLQARERVLTLNEAVSGGNGGGIVLTFDDGYRDFHEHVLPLLVRFKMPAVLYLASGLVAGERNAPDGQALTWSQLREAVSTGLVEVGAHTHSHVNLARAGWVEAEAEIRGSKELIEDRLGVGCRHFAYPWCVASLPARRMVARLFETAALDAWRTNRRGQIYPQRLGRTPILRSEGRTFFRAKVAGLLDGEALLYRALGRGPWKWGMTRPSPRALGAKL